MSELDARYLRESGHIFTTGTHALVRLPLMQRARDAAAGLNTGGLISGYRGSPLGGYDKALWGAASLLKDAGIHFQPAVNEDLAATAIWGSQQVNLQPQATVDGVFGIWYGKGPGVDRSVDPLRHGNLAGSSRHGGVLLVCGDDHGCQSSTLPHQSEQTLIAALIPVLNPATVQEYLEYGLLGIALSRYSGCWVGFKAVSETVERSESVWVSPLLGRVVLPSDFVMPASGLNIRWPDPPMEQEERLHGLKMQAVAAFARANRLDRIALHSPQPRLGIVATGKAYLDVCQAFDELGMSEAEAAGLGISIYKVGMSWPLEPTGIRAFAQGPEELLIVEEKRPLVEEQVAGLLYNVAASMRPRIVGKRDEQDRPLLPVHGELDPIAVAAIIVDRISRIAGEIPGLRERAARLARRQRNDSIVRIGASRTPFFCSGCPHNTSTAVPEGSRAIAGIGCHSMALRIPSRRTSTYTHMGGEGANWIGQAPFTAEKHVFQNLGDGTYFHSGLLAIRAAAAAGVNITYKILFNDAVAMTGGQPVEGGLTVPDVVRQVLAEGARKVAVVTDDPAKYAGTRAFAAGVTLHHRDELDGVQRQLRETPGLTVLIFDQTCAAEKRRRRKRGLIAEPPARVIINEAVCEGCGDCSEKSNCISILPLETPWGRKRQIDQSSCNKDYSCVRGFCPSFVTVRGQLRRGPAQPQLLDSSPVLPAPQIAPLDAPYNILVTGIGGTGVITIGALLGMAAHLEGKGCSVLDFTGLAQKNGAVTSHVRLARAAGEIHAARIPMGGADLLLACDLVVAVSAEASSRLEEGRTHAVINASVAPTAEFLRNGDLDFEVDPMQRAIRRKVGDACAHFVDATEHVTAALGDSINTNVFMIGYALQKGLLPLSLQSIERAIEINGVAVNTSKRALELGRRAAMDPGIPAAATLPAGAGSKAQQGLAAIVAARVEFLARYQDAGYAADYRRFVEQVERAERDRTPSCSGLAEAVARSVFKLMSYKDEYEVARLHVDPQFLQRLRAQFGGDFKLQFHLAPPLLARRDPGTGEPRKIALGGWMLPVMRVLARMKVLRGTPFDLFGYTTERRLERQLIDDFRALMLQVVNELDDGNHALAVQIARVPETIRGFGHVKLGNLRKAKDREAELLAQFRAPPAQPSSLQIAAAG